MDNLKGSRPSYFDIWIVLRIVLRERSWTQRVEHLCITRIKRHLNCAFLFRFRWLRRSMIHIHVKIKVLTWARKMHPEYLDPWFWRSKADSTSSKIVLCTIISNNWDLFGTLSARLCNSVPKPSDLVVLSLSSVQILLSIQRRHRTDIPGRKLKTKNETFQLDYLVLYRF